MNFSAPPVDDGCRRIDRIVRRALVQELPVPLRQLYRSVLITTLSEGLPVDPDALAVLLSTLDECADDPMRINSALIEQLLWFEIAAFCARSQLQVPSGCAAALFAAVAIVMGDEAVSLRVEDPEAVFGVLSQLSA